MTNENAAPAVDPNAGPALNVLGQYVKDFSFENPNAPSSLAPQQTQPQISINVNVGAQPLSQIEFDVDLRLEAKATVGETVLFNVELVYSGLFRIQNVPEEHLHPFVLIECPRLLFPFARQILADATRNGGFPPLMLDPIDFVALYQQNAAAAATQGEAPTVN